MNFLPKLYALLGVIFSGLLFASSASAQSYEEYMQQYGAQPITPQQQQQAAPQYEQYQPQQQYQQQQQVQPPYNQGSSVGGYAATYPRNFNQLYMQGCVNQPIKTPIPISNELKTDYCNCMANQMKQRMSFQDFRLMDDVTGLQDMKRMPKNVLDGVQGGANTCFIQSGAKMFFGK